MLSSLAARDAENAAYRDLAGARVLLTGVPRGAGLGLVRAFGRVRARLVVQSTDGGAELGALAADLARMGVEIRLETRPFEQAVSAARFAQDAARRLGGIDAVVNVISMTAAERARALSSDDAEESIHDILLPACLVTRVAANRMRMMLKGGSIVNILAPPPAVTRASSAFASFARAALAAMTRIEARAWSRDGVRVNAMCLAPDENRGAGLSAPSRDDRMAALALRLSSREGRRISGLVLDPEHGLDGPF